MSRQSVARALDAVEAAFDSLAVADSLALLEAVSEEELAELERLIDSGDEQAAAELWSRLSASYESGAGV